MAPGVGPAKTQTSPSLRKRPEGMAVPGIIFAGSVIQRAVQAGCRRSCGRRKFGAEVFLSCPSLPVMWHFKHGAAGLVKRPRAMARSASLSGSTFGGMNGWGGGGKGFEKKGGLGIL